MKNIPNIAFKNSDNTINFEFLNLSELFTRIPSFADHNPYQPHRITFFALIIVTKGTGSHQIDLKDYTIKPGTVLKIAKGQIHAFQKNAQYKGHIIIFTENFVINHFSKSSINIISHLYNYHIISPIFYNKEDNDAFIKQLILEFETKNTYAKENIIATILNLYLLRLERKTNKELQSSNSKNYAIFIEFKNLVETKYTTTRNVKDYAGFLFITTKNLNQIVREFTINTAKTFIDNYVILESKRAIVSTNKSLKEIAYNTGFNEVTNFSKFFKKKIGLTPKAFRKKHL